VSSRSINLTEMEVVCVYLQNKMFLHVRGYTIRCQVSQTFLYRQSYPTDREWEGNDGTKEWLQGGRPDAMMLDGTVETGYGESVDYTVGAH